jgi:hypothetical protein
MSKVLGVGFGRPSTVLFAALALALAGAPALARVGVTSATDGDPLGKPPTEAERVLRIGIDVQANEVVTTHANDRAHLVFLDGTSVTVGPNARITIDRFVYDPGAKKGELSLTATAGVLRVVGGKISKSGAISVTTPSGTLGIRGGIAIISVTNSQTSAAFVFGTSLTVNANGQTQTITRPGFQIVTGAGMPPGQPTAIPKGGLTSGMAALEHGSGSGGGSSPRGGNADQQVQNSGFANQNSGQAGNPPLTPFQGNNVGNTTTNAVSNGNVQSQTVSAQSTTPPATTTMTPPDTTKTRYGYASGLIVSSNGNQTNTPVLGNPTDVSVVSDPSTTQIAGGVKGTIIIRQSDNSINTLELGGTASTSVFVNDQTYLMTTTDDPSRKSTVQVGASKFIVQDSSVLVSLANPGIPISGTAGPCTCEYLSWGWWASTINYTNGHRANQSDTIALAPYVVGVLTTAVQMPQTGSATYTGFMAGNVLHGTNAYSALGSYNSTVDFAKRAGSFNASFDGASYAGTIGAVPGSGGTSFTGNLAGAGRTGAVAGAFFASPSDPAKYQAGTFAIGTNSSTYKAAGIFAGQR